MPSVGRPVPRDGKPAIAEDGTPVLSGIKPPSEGPPVGRLSKETLTVGRIPPRFDVKGGMTPPRPLVTPPTSEVTSPTAPVASLTTPSTRLLTPSTTPVTSDTTPPARLVTAPTTPVALETTPPTILVTPPTTPVASLTTFKVLAYQASLINQDPTYPAHKTRYSTHNSGNV